MKDKLMDIFSGIGSLLFAITFSLGWIYNIVWIFDNWGHLSTIAKIGEIASVFIAPLGALLGVIHFF